MYQEARKPEVWITASKGTHWINTVKVQVVAVCSCGETIYAVADTQAEAVAKIEEQMGDHIKEVA